MADIITKHKLKTRGGSNIARSHKDISPEEILRMLRREKPDIMRFPQPEYIRVLFGVQDVCRGDPSLGLLMDEILEGRDKNRAAGDDRKRPVTIGGAMIWSMLSDTGLCGLEINYNPDGDTEVYDMVDLDKDQTSPRNVSASPGSCIEKLGIVKPFQKGHDYGEPLNKQIESALKVLYGAMDNARNKGDDNLDRINMCAYELERYYNEVKPRMDEDDMVAEGLFKEMLDKSNINNVHDFIDRFGINDPETLGFMRLPENEESGGENPIMCLNKDYETTKELNKDIQRHAYEFRKLGLDVYISPPIRRGTGWDNRTNQCIYIKGLPQ